MKHCLKCFQYWHTYELPCTLSFQISFSQFPKIDLVHFFVTFFRYVMFAMPEQWFIGDCCIDVYCNRINIPCVFACSLLQSLSLNSNLWQYCEINIKYYWWVKTNKQANRSLIYVTVMHWYVSVKLQSTGLIIVV